jgi:hypothetical protein
MEVSNSSGQDTQYRVGHGGAQAGVNWQPLAAQESFRCTDPQAPWTIEFRLADGTVVSRTFQHPRAFVELVKDGNHYKVKTIRVAA